MGRGTFEGMMSGFSRTPSTTPCGPDVRISPHAVGQRSNWPAAEAVKCHIKFSHWKIPLWCGLLSKFFDYLLYVAMKNQREECSVSSVSRLHVVDELLWRSGWFTLITGSALTCLQCFDTDSRASGLYKPAPGIAKGSSWRTSLDLRETPEKKARNYLTSARYDLLLYTIEIVLLTYCLNMMKNSRQVKGQRIKLSCWHVAAMKRRFCLLYVGTYGCLFFHESETVSPSGWFSSSWCQ